MVLSHFGSASLSRRSPKSAAGASFGLVAGWLAQAWNDQRAEPGEGCGDDERCRVALADVVCGAGRRLGNLGGGWGRRRGNRGTRTSDRPADLTHLYLANNSFSGCIPAELSSITNNDLSQLSLTDCAAPSDISYGKHTLTAGTYEFALVDDGPAVMFDVPDGLNLELVGIVFTDSDDGGETFGLILRNTAEQSWICIDLEHAEECYRRIVSTSTDPDGVAALLDRLSESIWMDESP